MAHISATVTILAANIVSTAGGTIARFATDLTRGHDIPRIPAGQTRFSISWAYTGREAVSSNDYAYGYEVTVWIRHRLASATNESAWLNTTPWEAETLARALGSPAFWKLGSGLTGTNADIYAFQEADDALVLSELEREGNVISFSAVAKILLNA